MKSGDRSNFSNPTNPYHSNSLPADVEEAGALNSFKDGLSYGVDDLVKLELTAEQMVVEEVDLAKAYIREDAQGIWSDMKLGLTELELITGDWLLRAADPTRVEWQLNHWWEDEESQFRH